MQTITESGEFGHARIVGTHIGVTRWSCRSTTMLLAEDSGEIVGRSLGDSTGPPTRPFVTNHVESTLCNAPDERHNIFLGLQLRTQRP